MKKLSGKIMAILMAVLVLSSAFTFVVSAEGEPVNYALTGDYVITPGNDTGFLESEDGSKYYGDDLCEILKDGVSPYYTTTTEDGQVIAGAERPGESVVLVGSGTVHVITFDLGATYDDIYEITFGNVWDSYTFGWANGDGGQGNRGFRADKAIIKLAADGVNYEKNKDFEVVKDNHTEDGSENGYYDFRLKFNTPVTAKAIEMTIFSPTYCLSFSELEIWGYGHSIPTPEISEEESEEEPIEESSEEVVSNTESEESEDESEAEESKEESKAEESKVESEEKSEAASEDNDKNEGVNPIIFVAIGAAVLVVAVIVIVVLKKKK